MKKWLMVAIPSLILILGLATVGSIVFAVMTYSVSSAKAIIASTEQARLYARIQELLLNLLMRE